MKWLLIAIGVVCLVPVSFAGQPSKARMDRIWKAANDRMVEQNDHWFKKGDFPRAIQLMRYQVELAPWDYEAVTNLGWLLESTKQYDEALAVYIKFRLRNKSNVEAAFPEADFYFKRRAYAKVPPLLEPTIAKKPHPNSYRTLAHSYERLGLLKDSQRVWEGLIKLTPDDGAAKLNLDRVKKKLQNKPRR